ncbi:MAG: gamma-glutamylcyclotransferase [Planctomycetaceae bacterium]|nr:gamma-glutamylcyclotransferase [Planctomycetales bacterium]MCB9924743.1 gamma-glutamylcyclotransferase [Planctomycetaceae bacterium]
MKYFAYGSNCNPAIMKRKGVEFTSRQRATLRGYRLKFNKKSLRESLPDSIGFANINADAEGVVEGVLYEIPDEHWPPLDASERCPEHYKRVRVEVETETKTHECFAYQAQPDKIADGLVPSRNYLNHILTARDFLSQQYYEALDKAATYTGECFCCHNTGEVLFLKEFEQMYTLCQSCREARIVWGDVRGRRLTVPETEAVMTGLVANGSGFSSLQALVEEAIRLALIDP